MKTSIRTLWADLRLTRESFRIGLMVVLAYVLLIRDASNQLIIDAIGTSILFALASHINRRILFTKVDLQDLIIRASSNPIGAGLAVLSICLVLVAMMWTSLMVLT